MLRKARLKRATVVHWQILAPAGSGKSYFNNFLHGGFLRGYAGAHWDLTRHQQPGAMFQNCGGLRTLCATSRSRRLDFVLGFFCISLWGFMDIVLRLYGYRSGAFWISFWSFMDIVLELYGYCSGAFWILFFDIVLALLDIVVRLFGYRSGAL